MIRVASVADSICVDRTHLMKKAVEQGVELKKGEYGAWFMSDADAKRIQKEVSEWRDEMWSGNEAAEAIGISAASFWRFRNAGLVKGKKCPWVYSHHAHYSQEELSEILYRIEFAAGGRRARDHGTLEKAIRFHALFPGVKEYEKIRGEKNHA